MQTLFDKDKAKWAINWPGRISQYDLVYQAPADDSMRGLALGNGDVGALCWTRDSKLFVALNKCDLWEDGKDGPVDDYVGEKDMSVLRHGGLMTIDFHVPIFDVLYIDGFDGRLSLADATIKLAVKTPFGKVDINGRVDFESGVFNLDIKKKFKDKSPVSIQIERFGSRHLPYWYNIITTDTSKGLAGTTSKAAKDMMSLSQKMKNGTFTLGMTIHKAKASYARINNNKCKAEIKGDSIQLLAAITSPLKTNSAAKCRDYLKNFSDTSIKKHEAAWKEFWLRSFMQSGDDYNDNMWHLAMYYSRSSQGGKFPGRFIDGLWAHYHDFNAWGYYFHWNQQQLYWPLESAGHFELTRAYLEYRFAGLKNAKKDCKQIYKLDGAFVSDVSDHRGCNVTDIEHNHTPVVQIAMDFWRYYEYTRDEEFLKTRALPYMIEAAKFFASRFEKQADGKYHAKEASSYEGWRMIVDATTELASAKALFGTLLNAIENTEFETSDLEKWQDILDNLADYVLMDLGDEYFDDGKYVMGRFTGEKIKYKRMITTGVDAKTGESIVSRWPAKNRKKSGGDNIHDILCKVEKCVNPDIANEWDTDGDDGTFPWSELAMVFPHGHLGIKDKNSDLYKAAVTTAKLYSLEGTGWSTVPVAFARLGLAKELSAVLKDFAYRWQISPNGWVHWGVRTNMKPETAVRFRTGKLTNYDLDPEQRQKDENKFEWPSWDFRHTSMESLYILACAMNESLLQSWDGVLRIAPAVAKNLDAKFTLHATGGFEVSAEIQKGKVKWISIKSKTNNTAVIQNPWKKIFVYDKGRQLEISTKKTISIEMKKGQRIFLVENPGDMKNWKVERSVCSANKQPKEAFNGLAKLGLGKCFK